MDDLKDLIHALKNSIPELDPDPLYASVPTTLEPETVLDWLYDSLSAQHLMVYEEWTEYTGYLPALKPLASVSLPVDPSEYLFTLIENINWSEAEIEPWDLPYIMPWLEHINHYLSPQGIRLVDILPFENAYIICLKNDDALIQQLHACLQKLGMGINMRSPMNQQQVLTYIESTLSGNVQ